MEDIQEGDTIKLNTSSSKRIIIRRFKGNIHHIAFLIGMDGLER